MCVHACVRCRALANATYQSMVLHLLLFYSALHHLSITSSENEGMLNCEEQKYFELCRQNIDTAVTFLLLGALQRITPLGMRGGSRVGGGGGSLSLKMWTKYAMIFNFMTSLIH